MSKQINQKQKLLYILKILQEQSDEQHPITAQRIIDELEKNDIYAERKSIYDDMKQLQDFGYDIVHIKSKTNGGYYWGERLFELAELKLLVDAVSAFRFVSQKKSREMIKKMESLLSKNDAKQLNRQVYVTNRIKTENEGFYYQVDEIHRALQLECQIQFQYMEWNLNKELVPKKDGALYRVSPFALTCKEENYYLIAYDGADRKIKHYRVDKMAKTAAIEGSKREGDEWFEQFDLAAYTNKTFGMFGGEETVVTLDMKPYLLGVVLDRFGKDIFTRPTEDGWIRVRVPVAVSGQFFGWIASFADEMKIVSPEIVKEDYLKHMKRIQEIYD